MPLLRSPLSIISHSFRWTDISVLWALLPMSFWIPRKEPPNGALANKDAPFPEPSYYLLKFPVNGPPGSATGPWGHRCSSPELSSTLFPHSPSKRGPLHVPQQGPHGEKRFFSRANGLFIRSFTYLYFLESPVRSPPTTDGELYWSTKQSPCTWWIKLGGRRVSQRMRFVTGSPTAIHPLGTALTP